MLFFRSKEGVGEWCGRAWISHAAACYDGAAMDIRDDLVL